MVLASNGEPKYPKLIKDYCIYIKLDSPFALDMSYYNYCTSLTMTNEKFDTLFGWPPCEQEFLLTQREMDFA